MKGDKIIGAIEGVTKKWAKQRKREERERSAEANRRYVMTRCRHVSVKEAAWDIMEEAYLKASADGTLPAHARQIMYAARPHIMRYADRQIGKDFDQYFTQTLLPDYIEDNCCDWNVVFDARGHFSEPHQDGNVPLGTIQVRNYLGRVESHKLPEQDYNIRDNGYPTAGPANRYGAILFIEKEGFMPLFEAVNLAKRFDIALMSTKGMSNTAARELVDTLCGDHDIPLLVLHDFDKAGFSILGTLSRDTRRYCFNNEIKVIDLGLRLDDIDGLETEKVFSNESPDARTVNLRENGATEAEIEFLLDGRVELNAMASDQLVAFIERKFAENGVKKVVPDNDTLAAAFRRMRRQALVQSKITEVLEELDDNEDEVEVPDDLRPKIEEWFAKRPELRWDSIVRHLAGDEDREIEQ
jgi:hypothetical protein